MNLKIAGAAPDAHAAAAKDKQLEVARKFEGILMQQLLQVMRSTAKSGGMMESSGASGQYMAMFDEVLAERMAEGGGIGLAKTFAESLGGGPGAAEQPLTGTTGLRMPSPTGGLSMSAAAATAQPLPGLSGATARLAKAAYAISAPAGGKQWAREGTLTERDLASNLETTTAGGVARFSVRDAAGFRDAYKCNLFAFEAARRAGFEVPVVARAQGWGFPTSNTVTEDAKDGALRGAWAEVVPKEKLADVKGMLERGELAIMLTGSGQEGRHGHMAVVERIHRIDVDEHGELKHIEFDGYEARVDGAQHLTRRSWNRHGNGEDKRLARNGFENIELLALRPARSPEQPEIRLSGGVRPSRADSP
jgi:Rod binding domain-containing protein